jgi:hypothetical protein
VAHPCRGRRHCHRCRADPNRGRRALGTGSHRARGICRADRAHREAVQGHPGNRHDRHCSRESFEHRTDSSTNYCRLLPPAFYHRRQPRAKPGALLWRNGDCRTSDDDQRRTFRSIADDCQYGGHRGDAGGCRSFCDHLHAGGRRYRAGRRVCTGSGGRRARKAGGGRHPDRERLPAQSQARGCRALLAGSSRLSTWNRLCCQKIGIGSCARLSPT